MDILIAFLVVAGIALILGVLLALISHFFSVPENPVQQQVRACLPGVNCGACGYTGCDDYAAALAEGGVAPNLCIPGAQAVADEIGASLGVEAGAPVNEMVAFVACNGNCEATGKKAVYDGVATCTAASMLFGGDGSCVYGCLGFGDCTRVCKFDAIHIVDGIAKVDEEKCVGCMSCSAVCPRSLIIPVEPARNVVIACASMARSSATIRGCTVGCLGCGKCEEVCPKGAIKVEKNLAVIDYTKCDSCGKCAEICPNKLIKDSNVEHMQQV